MENDHVDREDLLLREIMDLRNHNADLNAENLGLREEIVQMQTENSILKS
ncbi:MAG: hypothetical protein HKL80_02480 [Acidimicrobiales bacterium]|nr:hypothetical protein [Acidimicrobiales bacterium]